MQQEADVLKESLSEYDNLEPMEKDLIKLEQLEADISIKSKNINVFKELVYNIKKHKDIKIEIEKKTTGTIEVKDMLLAKVKIQGKEDEYDEQYRGL